MRSKIIFQDALSDILHIREVGEGINTKNYAEYQTLTPI
jgi:hypothetical protein